MNASRCGRGMSTTMFANAEYPAFAWPDCCSPWNIINFWKLRGRPCLVSSRPSHNLCTHTPSGSDAIRAGSAIMYTIQPSEPCASPISRRRRFCTRAVLIAAAHARRTALPRCGRRVAFVDVDVTFAYRTRRHHPSISLMLDLRDRQKCSAARRPQPLGRTPRPRWSAQSEA